VIQGRQVAMIIFFNVYLWCDGANLIVFHSSPVCLFVPPGLWFIFTSGKQNNNRSKSRQKNEKVKEMNDQQLISWWFLGVVENSGAGS